MNNGILHRLFAIGRLAKDPPRHTAGRVLAPASAQRTQLGLRELNLRDGIVILRNGEARAVLTVSGLPVHHYSREAATGFLQRWATALNALPADAVFLLRSRGGGLDKVIAERQSQQTALALRPQSGGLVKLAADQVKHLLTLNGSGRVRKNDCFVVVRGSRETVLETANAAQATLQRAGLKATLLRDKPLALAIAESWKPGIQAEAWIYRTEFPLSREAPVGLLYERGTKVRLAL